jgi:linoleoyl-CoA desaturase
MWLIHGKMYNLDGFLKTHPGGSLMLEATRGEDATASFESYHAMCDISKIRRIMEKYEVVNDNTITPTPTRFSDGEFYDTLRERVVAHFKSRGTSHHANWFWAMKSVGQLGLFSTSFILFCFGSEYSVFARGIIAIFSGHMLMQLLFCVMHDASHHAVSSNPRINEFISSTVSTFGLWDNSIWYKHHCFKHHAFTGTRMDPDTIHFRPLIRKSTSEPYKSYRFLSTSYLYFVAILTVFPGQWLGQSIYHFRAYIEGSVWRFTIPRRPDGWVEPLIRVATIGCLIYAARTHIILPILFAISVNLCYSVGVIPDHDTFETEQNLMRDISNTDWGEIQVRNSGNFSTDNPYTVNLFGGINYQIEHHMFPTICHVHHPEVSKIVKAACAEYTIPYVSHPTIASAYLSALKKFQYMAMDKPIPSATY